MKGEGNAAGQNDLIVHFGLGKAEVVDSVVFILPNHNSEKWVLENPAINKFHRISERTFVPESSNFITVYPNPVETNYLQISTVEGNFTEVSFKIYNRLGNLVTVFTEDYSAKHIIPIDGLSQGAYIVSVYFDGEYKESQKFLKL